VIKRGLKLQPDEMAPVESILPLIQSSAEVKQCFSLNDNFYLVCNTPPGLWSEPTILLFGRVITWGYNTFNADGTANCEGKETPFCGHIPILLRKAN